MEPGTESSRSWKGIKDAESARQLIDGGVIVRWKEMRSLKKELSDDDQCQILRYFATQLCQKSHNRLASEIIVESTLIWIANSIKESLIVAFFDQLFSEEGHDHAARTLVEIALTSEVAENSHDEELYSMAVALVCELGIAIRELEHRSPNSFKNAREVSDHITTYLLSVSNNNNTCIRLSLLHYFGFTSSKDSDKSAFNRVMNRFGHTVLDHLFSSLFNKKSEAISLQYLLENLPYVLESDAHCQRILHETFKYYMLKKPERFALFIQTFTENLYTHDSTSHHARRVMLQHIGALFKVVSEVNHKVLARELLIAMQHFSGEPFKNELFDHILSDSGIRPVFKDLLSQLKTSDSVHFAETVAQFRSPRRGRKPSFSRADHIGTMGQVSFLGNLELAKAS